jgi:hypothetical protein
MGQSLDGAMQLQHLSDQTDDGHGKMAAHKRNKIKEHKPIRTPLLKNFLGAPNTP